MPPRDDVLAALRAAHDTQAAVLDDLAEADFARPTRCTGWAVADVVQHLLLDAQRALVVLASPVTAAADTDAAGYWRDVGQADDATGALAHARFVRVCAAAFRHPSGLVTLWRDTTTAVVRAAGMADADGRFDTTQGHVMALPDFLTTLVVEAAVHHLDLTVDLPAASPPPHAALALVRRTLDGLLGREVPFDWDDMTYALKGGGRLPLDRTERGLLGDLADRFPLLS